jgi:hypothetical protein
MTPPPNTAPCVAEVLRQIVERSMDDSRSEWLFFASC